MIDIIFEDSHLLLLNKPAALCTQSETEVSLESLARDYIKEKYNKPGNAYCHATHRLDKPVCGLVLFAKTSKALSRILAAHRDRAYSKIYEAVVEGKVQKPAHLTHWLTHEDYYAKVASPGSPGAKEAKLSFTVVENNEDTSRLRIELHTGRYHQIRAQLAAIGHPIAGDQIYGAKTSSAAIALCSRELALCHPVTKENLHFVLTRPSFSA